MNQEPLTTVLLLELAHARSGDKGDTANVGVIAYEEEDYPLILEQVTATRVKEHFGSMVRGSVERFRLDNLHAVNFLLHGALDGGGTVSLMTDAQGKVFSTALLRMELEGACAGSAPRARQGPHSHSGEAPACRARRPRRSPSIGGRL